MLARPLAVLLPLAELACAIALIPGGDGPLGRNRRPYLARAVHRRHRRQPRPRTRAELPLLRTAALGAGGLDDAGAEHGAGGHRGHDHPARSNPAGRSIVSWATAVARMRRRRRRCAGGAGRGHPLAVSGGPGAAAERPAAAAARSGRSKARIVATAPAAGLPVDSPAPAFTFPDLDGGTVTLASLRDNDKPLLLVFSEPGCGACDLLLPDVARWQHEHADRLSTVVISRGTVGQNRNKRAKLDLKTFCCRPTGKWPRPTVC